MIRNKLTLGILLVVLLFMLSISACLKAEHTGQYYSYPPGSKPHENDWEYLATVIVRSYKGPITIKICEKCKDKNTG